MDNDKKRKIVTISQQYYDEAHSARLPLERVWDKIWNLYNNIIDFSDKAPWQSKKFIPKIANAVRSGASFLKRALIRARNFFVVEAKKPQLKEFEPAIFHNLKMWLDDNKFISQFAESVTSALMCNLMIFKVFWKFTEDVDKTGLETKAQMVEIKKDRPKADSEKEMSGMSEDERFIAQNLPTISESLAPAVLEETRKRGGKLKISVVNPYRFYLDPTGRRRYCIHEEKEDLAFLRQNASKKGYDMSEINMIQESYSDFDKEYKEKYRQGLNREPPKFRKEVLLREYWGDIFDEDGELLYTNVTWTVANEKWLIREPKKNPALDGLWPFVWGPVTKKPFSVYHKSLMEDATGLAETINDLHNMAMDTNAFSGARAFEIDLDMVVDPEELKSGLYPGKVVKKRSGGVNSRMIQEIVLGQVSPQILRLYQESDREFQNATTQTEFLVGKPSMQSGRATATEIRTKTAQSGTAMEDMALDMEDGVLAPLLEKMYHTSLQYQTDFNDPRLQAVSDDLKARLLYYATQPDEVKKDYLDLWDFKVRGLSGVIAREGEIQKIMLFLQTIAPNPQMMMYVKIQNIFSRIMEAFNWDPVETLRSEQEVRQIQMQMAEAQARGAAQGQGQGKTNQIRQKMEQGGM